MLRYHRYHNIIEKAIQAESANGIQEGVGVGNDATLQQSAGPTK